MTHEIAHESGSGIPLILIPGLGTDHHALELLEPALVGFERIYLPILPGDAWGDLTAAAVATELAQLTRRRIQDAPFAVLGHSFGGFLARRLQAEFGDQVLGGAFLAPVVEPDFGRRSLPPAPVVDLSAADSLPPPARAEYAKLAVRPSKANVQRFLDYVWPGMAAADPGRLQRIRDTMAGAGRPSVGPITRDRPTLFILGRQDAITGYAQAAELAETYPHATTVIFDGAGHLVHLDEPGLVIAHLSRWAQHVQTEAAQTDDYSKKEKARA